MSDPAKGRVKYTHEEFRKGWYPEGEKRGKLLAVEPTADFRDSQEEKKSNETKLSSYP